MLCQATQIAAKKDSIKSNQSIHEPFQMLTAPFEKFRRITLFVFRHFRTRIACNQREVLCQKIAYAIERTNDRFFRWQWNDETFGEMLRSQLLIEAKKVTEAPHHLILRLLVDGYVLRLQEVKVREV